MRKVLYLLGEPLDIQTLYEQSIYIVLRFKNGEVRKDMTGFESDLAVWLNQGTNLITGSTQSGAITLASTANDAILDEMRIFIDFIGTNTACPAPYSYNYRLNIEKDGIDTFALNGKFVILDVAPDDFQIEDVQPSTVTFTQTSVSVSVQTMDVVQLRNEALAFRNQAEVFKNSASGSAVASANSAALASQKADEISNAFLAVHTRIAKYTAENQLPLTGDARTVYFLNVAGNKYLKYWDGTAYVNASTKTDLPKCISSIQRDYYATFADISTANYNVRNASICVISDETQNNQTGLYFYDGTNLNWIAIQ
jgi:hypothetical protein